MSFISSFGITTMCVRIMLITKFIIVWHSWFFRYFSASIEHPVPVWSVAIISHTVTSITSCHRWCNRHAAAVVIRFSGPSIRLKLTTVCLTERFSSGSTGHRVSLGEVFSVSPTRNLPSSSFTHFPLNDSISWFPCVSFRSPPIHGWIW